MFFQNVNTYVHGVYSADPETGVIHRALFSFVVIRFGIS